MHNKRLYSNSCASIKNELNENSSADKRILPSTETTTKQNERKQHVARIENNEVEKVEIQRKYNDSW